MGAVVGQYRIIDKIGKGGMSDVFKAEHVTLEQIVALKVLPNEFSSNQEMRDRFIREAKIQAKLSHTNVVNLFNFFEHEGNFYLVMEYIEGVSIGQMIKRDGPIPLKKSLALFEQVLEGMGYAHARGIVHRDIKPNNVMVTSDGVVKITDFGIAKITGDMQLTRSGVRIGTIPYMSPEQVRGQPLGVTSDIYSLGITLFEMLTGRVPFMGDSEYHLMKAIVEEPPPSPKELRPGLPPFVEQAILKSVAKAPSERFQNTKEFVEALRSREVLHDDPPTIIAGNTGDTSAIYKDYPSSREFHKMKIQEKKVFWAAIAGLLVFGAIFFALSYFRSDSTGKVEVTPSKTEQVIVQPPPDLQKTPAEVSPPPVQVEPLKPVEPSPAKTEPVVAKPEPPVKPAEKKPAEPKATQAGTDRDSDRNQSVKRFLSRAGQLHEEGAYDKAIEMYNMVLSLDAKNRGALSGIQKSKKAKAAESSLTGDKK